MAHPGLSAESDSGASGNYGLLDIIAALKWVRENIAVFGGDPEAVTLVGHSSGAENVLSLMVSPLAAGLFHRAVVMAPGMGMHPFQHARRQNYGGFASMELLGEIKEEVEEEERPRRRRRCSSSRLFVLLVSSSTPCFLTRILPSITLLPNNNNHNDDDANDANDANDGPSHHFQARNSARLPSGWRK